MACSRIDFGGGGEGWLDVDRRMWLSVGELSDGEGEALDQAPGKHDSSPAGHVLGLPLTARDLSLRSLKPVLRMTYKPKHGLGNDDSH